MRTGFPLAFDAPRRLSDVLVARRSQPADLSRRDTVDRADLPANLLLGGDYPDVEQIDLHCERPAGHEGRCRDGDSTWERDRFGLGDLETHRWDSEPVPVAAVRWRISKGRPEWRATLPDRPWVLIRRTPYRYDGDWAAVACCPTWQVALSELALDADLIARGIR